MQAITAYKVLGGWAAAGAIGRAGTTIDKAVTGGGGIDVGGLVASAASGVMGYIVAQKPNLASAGYAQLAASGLYAIGSLIYTFITPPSVAQRQDDRQYLTSQQNPDDRRLNLGPGGTCVCQSCGAVIPHETGRACFLINCPVCNAPMTRQTGRILA